MYRMAVIRLKRGMIRELHYTTNDKALAARRNIFSDVGFEYQRYMFFQLADFAQHAILLRFGDSRLQSKSKHMNEHWICILFPWNRMQRFLVTSSGRVNKNERCSLVIEGER
jgi:hypothetical protein